MILGDTSVWSLILRRKATANLSTAERALARSLEEATRNGRAVMIGPIRQELLSGIKHQAQFDKLKAKLDAFRDEPIETADYEYAAVLFNEAVARGVACGQVDLLICAVASRRNWEVLSNDDGLNRCLELIQALKQP